MDDDLRELSAAIQRNLVAAQELSDRARLAQAELSGVVGRGRSHDGAVTVEVGHDGLIRSLEFSEDALDEGAAALGPAVVATVQRAIADLQRQAAEVRDRVALDGPRVVDLGDVSDRFQQLLNDRARGGRS